MTSKQKEQVMALRKKGCALSVLTTLDCSTPNIIIVMIPNSIIAPVDIAAVTTGPANGVSESTGSTTWGGSSEEKSSASSTTWGKPLHKEEEKRKRMLLAMDS
jgi:hypothetical protein